MSSQLLLDKLDEARGFLGSWTLTTVRSSAGRYLTATSNATGAVTYSAYRSGDARLHVTSIS